MKTIKPKIRKYVLLTLFTSVFTLVLTGQNPKFTLSLEYSPNYSKITDNNVNEKVKFSHSIFLKSEFIFKGNIHPTFGIGFLNTGEQESTKGIGELEIEEVIFKHNYNYLLIPFGVNLRINNIYINPELGIGYNISNKMMTITKYSEGKVEKKSQDEDLYSGKLNSISIPVLLSLGYEFNLGNMSFLSGIKGYYGINKVVRGISINPHYYGLGLLFGMKF